MGTHQELIPITALIFAVSPWQVVAIDPDLGENGTVLYSIRPPNKFYSLNSTTGKIRTTSVLLDRENPNAQEAQLMRRIVVSVTDCKLRFHPAPLCHAGLSCSSVARNRWGSGASIALLTLHSSLAPRWGSRVELKFSEPDFSFVMKVLFPVLSRSCKVVFEVKK